MMAICSMVSATQTKAIRRSASFLILSALITSLQLGDALVPSSSLLSSMSSMSSINTRNKAKEDSSLLLNSEHIIQQTSSSKSALRMSSINIDRSPPPFPVRVAVMGGGNFGLALATVTARKKIPTTLLIRDEEIAKTINTTSHHPRYMTDIKLPELVKATTDPKEALSDATYIIHAVPCQYSRSFLGNVGEHVPKGVPVLSASKGIETTSLGFMQDILKECLGEERYYAFLSGPIFAREICEGVATAVVIASEDLMLADELADLMSDDSFRVFTSQDVIGVEIGGAVKNVIALAAGMCEGLGLGTNAMSGLVTRGCAEMRRLGLTLGARPSTIAGLSGVGDTFGTCFGPLSRNRKFGYRLGKGETMEDILASTTEVAEGVETSKALVQMIKSKCKGYRLDLKFPILFGVADILEGKQTPEEGLRGLMTMPMRMESFDERGYYTVSRSES
jgi:glycerol-3-phosphate dehydrogenase (NAD+)